MTSRAKVRIKIQSHVRCVLNLILILNKHLYLNDAWLGVNQRADTNYTCVEKRVDCVLQNLLINLDLILKFIRESNPNIDSLKESSL